MHLLRLSGICPLSPKACDWGILHEPRAKQQYTERTDVVIQDRGLFLSNSGLLGGSPDGMVFGDCVIEVKCPWSARNKTILQAAESRDFFLEFDEAIGSLTLKQTHNYWSIRSRETYTWSELTAVTWLCGLLFALLFCQCSKTLHGLLILTLWKHFIKNISFHTFSHSCKCCAAFKIQKCLLICTDKLISQSVLKG